MFKTLITVSCGMKLASPLGVIKLIKITKADFYKSPRLGSSLKKYTVLWSLHLVHSLSVSLVHVLVLIQKNCIATHCDMTECKHNKLSRCVPEVLPLSYPCSQKLMKRVPTCVVLSGVLKRIALGLSVCGTVTIK